MNEVPDIMQTVQLPAVTKKQPLQKPQVLVIDSEPDVAEFSYKEKSAGKKGSSIGRTFIASAAGIIAGKKVYECGKNFMAKGISYAEKEIGAFGKELGKDALSLPRTGKAIAKYGFPALAGILVAGIIIKDSDNDGKSDLAEAINKFINPGDGMY